MMNNTEKNTVCHDEIKLIGGRKINTHYDEAKSKYEAYTLQQVLAILKNEEINLINE